MLGQAGGQVDRGGRLADAALLVRDRHDPAAGRARPGRLVRQAPYPDRSLGRPADRRVRLITRGLRNDDRLGGRVRAPAVSGALDGLHSRPLTVHLDASRFPACVGARIDVRARPAQAADTGPGARATGPAAQRDAFRPWHQRPVRPAQSRFALPVIARPHLCPASSSEEPYDGSRRNDLTVPGPHNPGVAGTNPAQYRFSGFQFLRCRTPLDRQHHASRPYQAHRQFR